MRAYAEANTAGASTKTGNNLIAKNMQKAGKTQRQINNALKRAEKLPNAKVTRV